MVEYSVEFSREMATAGAALLRTSPHSSERDRAAIYIALVACEVALKSALEKAGEDVKNIRKISHDFSALLDHLGACTVLEVIPPIGAQRVPASRIRAVVVNAQYTNATIGHLLCAEDVGASKYPNQVRYGKILKQFPAEVMIELADKVVSWVELHSNDIRK